MLNGSAPVSEQEAVGWLDRPLPGIDWEKALYGLFIVLALVTRLWELGARVMSHDEALHTWHSWELYRGEGFEHTPLMHGPLLFIANALSYHLFGDSDWSARLYPALLGVALVAFPYLLRRWLGRVGALAASFLFLISPSLLYYSRYIRHDIPAVLFALVMIWAALRYLEEDLRQDRWLVVLVVAMSLLLASKEVAFIYIAILGLFLLVYLFYRLGGAGRRLLPMILAGLAILVASIGLILLLLNLFGLYPVALTECANPEPQEDLGCLDGGCRLYDGRCQRPAPVIVSQGVQEFDQDGNRIAVGLADSQAKLAWVLWMVIALLTGLGLYLALRYLMPSPSLFLRDRGGARAFDLIITLGSLILPWLAALFVFQVPKLLSGVPIDPLDYSEGGLVRTGGFVAVLAVASVAVGLWWNWRRWLPIALIFYAIFALLFTTIFTNGAGLASGMVGSLGYWLEQQGVERGSQPLYYYLLMVPLYEYLPLVGAFAASLLWTWRQRLYGLFYTCLLLAAGGLLWLFLALWLQPSMMFPTRETSTPWLNGFLLVLGCSFLLGAVYLGDGLSRRRHRLTRGLPPAAGDLFVPFALFWTLFTWLFYSYAGEKMPWLTVHFAVPMILLTGWLVAQFKAKVDWRALSRRGGWWLVGLFPALLAGLVQVVGPWLSRPRPFEGRTRAQLGVTGQWLAALIILIGLLFLLRWLAQRTGWRALGKGLALLLLGGLTVLTVRTAWTFAYVNDDYPTEYLVYAHGGADVKRVMSQIEEISEQIAGERQIDVGYGEDGSLPFKWYFRNYPNAVQYPQGQGLTRGHLEKSILIVGNNNWGDVQPYLGGDYVCNPYTYLWWPMQDYFGLTWERLRYALFNPEMRHGVWDVVFRRDYRQYEAASGHRVRLSEWPLRNDFRLCIRQDLLPQVWDSHLAPTAASVAEAEAEAQPFFGLELDVEADLVVSVAGSPHGLAFDAEGVVYVADGANHRIVKVSPDGQILDTWDSTWHQDLAPGSWQPGCLDTDTGAPLAQAAGEFCEPWGVAVGPQGKVYVVDTWNHRVQVFAPDGQFISTWGQWGLVGEGQEGAETWFYGPRSLVVDQEGRVYVSDTGNKRVAIFDRSHQFLSSLGGGGVLPGYLDEPVGLALDLEGALYVADTWNRRVQVFAWGQGQAAFVREWPVPGWGSQSINDKPYIDVDRAGRVYVTDPENYRVLVFDQWGEPLVSLGQFGQDAKSFKLPSGLGVDPRGNLWVSDMLTGRLLRFPALDASSGGDG